MDARVDAAEWQARTHTPTLLAGNRVGHGRELFALMRRQVSPADRGVWLSWTGHVDEHTLDEDALDGHHWTGRMSTARGLSGASAAQRALARPTCPRPRERCNRSRCRAARSPACSTRSNTIAMSARVHGSRARGCPVARTRPPDQRAWRSAGANCNARAASTSGDAQRFGRRLGVPPRAKPVALHGVRQHRGAGRARARSCTASRRPAGRADAHAGSGGDEGGIQLRPAATRNARSPPGSLAHAARDRAPAGGRVCRKRPARGEARYCGAGASPGEAACCVHPAPPGGHRRPPRLRARALRAAPSQVLAVRGSVAATAPGACAARCDRWRPSRDSSLPAEQRSASACWPGRMAGYGNPGRPLTPSTPGRAVPPPQAPREGGPPRIYRSHNTAHHHRGSMRVRIGPGIRADR